ncbi:hypothetical protein [Pseudoalteromonas luteoviolacea]|uniref:Uncharacterized protein n=1 Tax=Pseudoalteromonas luteoviolacea (strain 2ta16) TaxID=1353533 RepID=V4HXR3_PSEL2|nr:hypothetical protein [Pseudoalteromonas luteoviolacea]ESP92734.1 hypothetical protein PL2TA16_03932 [Pseudoalteromonas luteoviolacea 2ta16]KZN35544.1 hypothetical protein N483_00900 [Pseudoalteromonas luteoviolacea NCIMB 1944]
MKSLKLDLLTLVQGGTGSADSPSLPQRAQHVALPRIEKSGIYKKSLED